MDKNTLIYYANILCVNTSDFYNACIPAAEIPDEAFKRALNALLDAIRSDVANLQYLIDN